MPLKNDQNKYWLHSDHAIAIHQSIFQHHRAAQELNILEVDALVPQENDRVEKIQPWGSRSHALVACRQWHRDGWHDWLRREAISAHCNSTVLSRIKTSGLRTPADRSITRDCLVYMTLQ